MSIWKCHQIISIFYEAKVTLQTCICTCYDVQWQFLYHLRMTYSFACKTTIFCSQCQHNMSVIFGVKNVDHALVCGWLQ